ncbi:MAG TPA: hypothetical protein VGL89_10715 [Candidatus Koribacter sp.]
MKKLWTVVVVLGLFGWLMGCATGKSLDNFRGGSGGGGGSTTSGNWDIELTSGTGGQIVGFGGHLVFTGSSVSGNLMPFDSSSSCLFPSQSSSSVAVSGTISNGKLPLNIATNGGTFAVTLTVPSGSSTVTSMSGTYSTTSGCLGTLSGSVSAKLVSGPLGGTWTGTDTAGNGAVLSFDFAVANSATATGSLQGTFQITPVSVNITPPAGCVVSGTTLNADSFAAGELLFLDVSESENGTPAEFLVYGVVDSATAPANFTGGYAYVSGGSCLLNTAGEGGFTLTKQ